MSGRSLFLAPSSSPWKQIRAKRDDGVEGGRSSQNRCAKWSHNALRSLECHSWYNNSLEGNRHKKNDSKSLHRWWCPMRARQYQTKRRVWTPGSVSKYLSVSFYAQGLFRKPRHTPPAGLIGDSAQRPRKEALSWLLLVELGKSCTDHWSPDARLCQKIVVRNDNQQTFWSNTFRGGTKILESERLIHLTTTGVPKNRSSDTCWQRNVLENWPTLRSSTCVDSIILFFSSFYFPQHKKNEEQTEKSKKKKKKKNSVAHTPQRSFLSTCGPTFEFSQSSEHKKTVYFGALLQRSTCKITIDRSTIASLEVIKQSLFSTNCLSRKKLLTFVHMKTPLGNTSHHRHCHVLKRPVFVLRYLACNWRKCSSEMSLEAVPCTHRYTATGFWSQCLQLLSLGHRKFTHLKKKKVTIAMVKPRAPSAIFKASTVSSHWRSFVTLPTHRTAL